MNRKRLIIYILVFFIALVVFLFLLFPREQMGAFVTRKLYMPVRNFNHSSSEKTKFYFIFKEIRPLLPFGLISDNTAIVLDSGPIISDFKMSVHIPFFSLLQHPMPILVQCNPMNGFVNMGLEAISFNPENWNFKNLSIQDIYFSDLLFDSGAGDMILNGVISTSFVQSGEIPVKFSSSLLKSLAGKGKFQCRDLGVKISNPWLSLVHLPPLEFSHVDGEFEINNGKVILGDFLLKGSVLHIVLYGSIGLKYPLGESKLALHVKILPDSPYLAQLANHPVVKMKVNDIVRKGLVFNVKGTVNSPRASL